MPRGDKSSYTAKQKRQAEHIEEGYEERGLSEGESERRAWATVNKMTGGGRKSGSGRGHPTDKSPARKGGRIGGRRAARSRSRSKSSSGSRSRSTRSRSRPRSRSASPRSRRTGVRRVSRGRKARAHA